MHFAEGILPGLHHHPLSRWLARFNVVDVAKPFSKEHLEPLEGKHEILALPYTTTPLAIPEALAECPYDDIEVAEGWNVDPKSVEFKMLAAYPILQPVYLAEFEMGDRHITALAHGHYDYFAIWGHENHPDTWVNNSPAGIVITYLRTLAMDLKGGPPAMTELITDSCSPENLEKIVREVDMNDLRIQPVSSANITRRWMELAGKADGMRFIIDNIPPNTTVINTATGDRIAEAGKGDPRGPLRRQLREIEAEMDASKPAWLEKWDELKHG
ncbi:hypothetical protein RhiJN_03148 [Ceratobasidium sp. AG-Ba]|nr:hypothetical protein RhiJN_03148 [Ceratobasidium sp. AG-Ba]